MVYYTTAIFAVCTESNCICGDDLQQLPECAFKNR